MSYPFVILFEGLCCHAQYNNRKRVLMPDASHVDYGEHQVHLECFEDDFDSGKSDFSLTDTYSRYNLKYGRIQLKNVAIKLRDVVSSSFQVTPSFEYRIPKLTEVAPKYGTVKTKFLTPTADKSIAGYFDIPGGILTTGPAEPLRTWFVDMDDKQTAWEKRCVAQWVQLELELKNDVPVFEIYDLNAQSTKIITLNAKAGVVTIGNQTKDDYLGNPYTGGHFKVWYDLLAETIPLPEDKPMPKHGMGLGVGCSNTNWP